MRSEVLKVEFTKANIQKFACLFVKSFHGHIDLPQTWSERVLGAMEILNS